MCEKISVRKDNSKFMCLSSDKKLKLNQWARLYYSDFVFSEDGKEVELISKEEIKNCYKGYYNDDAKVFLPTESMDNEDAREILDDLCETSIRCYIGATRPLDEDQIYFCDQNEDIMIYTDLEILSEGYKEYKHEYMYAGYVSGNLLRITIDISDYIRYNIKNDIKNMDSKILND